MSTYCRSSERNKVQDSVFNIYSALAANTLSPLQRYSCYAREIKPTLVLFNRRLLSQSDCRSNYIQIYLHIFLSKNSRAMSRRNYYLKTVHTAEPKTKNMNKGVVKFFNDAKGFGFISNENCDDIFVHVSGLNEDIREHDLVTYDTQNGKRGLNAINVSLA